MAGCFYSCSLFKMFRAISGPPFLVAGYWSGGPGHPVLRAALLVSACLVVFRALTDVLGCGGLGTDAAWELLDFAEVHVVPTVGDWPPRLLASPKCSVGRNTKVPRFRTESVAKKRWSWAPRSRRERTSCPLHSRRALEERGVFVPLHPQVFFSQEWKLSFLF